MATERPQVYVRFRSAPADLGSNANAHGEHDITHEDQRVSYPDPRKPGSKTHIRVDQVFKETSRQPELYEQVGRSMTSYVVSGYRGLVLAYGITGSGKTYTMLGGGDAADDGLVQQALRDVFSRQLPMLSVEAQALQCYREGFQDLGVEGCPNVKVLSTMVRDNTEASVHTFTAEEPAMSWLRGVISRRARAGTKHNKVSSRSHLLVRLKISFGTGDVITSGILDFSDLAGCEKLCTLDASSQKDHFCIQAGLASLENCIVSRVENASKPPHLRTLKPFTQTPLPRLLAPNFNGTTRIAVIVACPSTTERVIEVSESLQFAKHIARLKINPRAQEATVHATAQDLVIAADAQQELPGVPATREAAQVGPDLPLVHLRHHDEKEDRALRGEVKKKETEVQTLQDELDQVSRGFLAPEVGGLSRELSRGKRGSAADCVEKARRVLLKVKEWYPEVLDETWPEWSEALSPQGLDRESLQRKVTELGEAVARHEAELCALAKRKAELQRMQEEATTQSQGMDGSSAVQELFRRQLEVLERCLAEATSDRHELLKLIERWVTQWDALQVKKDDLSSDQWRLKLEGGEKSNTIDFKMFAGNLMEEDLDATLQEDFETDLSMWRGQDELQFAIDNLPKSATAIAHLLKAHPTWKLRFYDIGGIESMLEKMAKTRSHHWHRCLADSLSDIVDMERFSAEKLPSLRSSLVAELLEVVPKEFLQPPPSGARRISELEAECEEGRLRAYFELLEVVAKDATARRTLAEAGIVKFVSTFIRHKAQMVAIAALGGLGQVASHEIAAEKADVCFMINTVADDKQSARLREAAAKCLQRLCYGSEEPSKRTRAMLMELNAAALLTQVAQNLQMHADDNKRNTYHDIAKHVKYVVWLLLSSQPPSSSPGSNNGSAQVILEAVAAASVEGSSRNIEVKGEAAGVQYWALLREGGWDAALGAGNAGGERACSSFWMNPMYALSFKQLPPGKKTVSLAVAMLDPSFERGGDRGLVLKRSAYMSTIVAKLPAAAAESAASDAMSGIASKGLTFPCRSLDHKIVPLASESTTLQFMAAVDAERSYLIVPFLRAALQEKQYVLGVCADAPIELSDLAADGWHRWTYVGQWRQPHPRKQGFRGYDIAWRGLPQLLITNPSCSPASVCFILSYSSQDAYEMQKHTWHEELDQEHEDARCPVDKFPYLDMYLFDASAHPLHRYAGEMKATAQVSVLRQDYLELHATLPPGSVWSLAMGRSLFDGQGGSLSKDDVAASEKDDASRGFRLQVLAENSDLDLRPLDRASEWHTFQSEVLRVEDASKKEMRLKLSARSKQSQRVRLLLLTTTNVWTRLTLSDAEGREILPQDGKANAPFTSHPGPHYEFELAGNVSECKLSIMTHGDSELPFLMRVLGYSLYSEATLQCESAHGSPVNPPVVKARNEQEADWLEEWEYMKLPSRQQPQTAEDLQLEEHPFPPRPQAGLCDPNSDDQVLVNRAYLEKRLFPLAQRGQAAMRAAAAAAAVSRPGTASASASPASLSGR